MASTPTPDRRWLELAYLAAGRYLPAPPLPPRLAPVAPLAPVSPPSGHDPLVPLVAAAASSRVGVLGLCAADLRQLSLARRPASDVQRAIELAWVLLRRLPGVVRSGHLGASSPPWQTLQALLRDRSFAKQVASFRGPHSQPPSKTTSGLRDVVLAMRERYLAGGPPSAAVAAANEDGDRATLASSASATTLRRKMPGQGKLRSAGRRSASGSSSVRVTARSLSSSASCPSFGSAGGSSSRGSRGSSDSSDSRRGRGGRGGSSRMSNSALPPILGLSIVGEGRGLAGLGIVGKGGGGGAVRLDGDNDAYDDATIATAVVIYNWGSAQLALLAAQCEPSEAWGVGVIGGVGGVGGVCNVGGVSGDGGDGGVGSVVVISGEMCSSISRSATLGTDSVDGAGSKERGAAAVSADSAIGDEGDGICGYKGSRARIMLSQTILRALVAGATHFRQTNAEDTGSPPPSPPAMLPDASEELASFSNYLAKFAKPNPPITPT